MKDDFGRGWEFYSKVTPDLVSAELSNDWANNVNLQYQKIAERCAEVCNQRVAQNSALAQGFLAEMWHTETFNLNALIKGSESVAIMLEETALGSADIRITNDKLGLFYNISSKYYKTGAASAHEQSLSIYERFCRYAAQHHIDVKDDNAFQEYLVKNGLDINTSKEAGLYHGQLRLIPQEQIRDSTKNALDKLDRDIAKARARGNAAAVERLVETKNAICGVIGDGTGAESIALSRDDAEKIIQLCKNDEFHLSDYLDLRSLISLEDIMRDSVKSGANAALLSVIFGLAPEIIKSIQFLIANGQLDVEQIKRMGWKSISSSSRGFITGTISAALTSSAKLGFLGETMKSMRPESIGALTALTYQICVIAFDHAIGKSSSGEMKNELLRAVFSTGCSVAFGSFAALINPLAYLLGSMIGSIAGSLIYGTIYQSYISFCTDTGFTLFGLVEQDYTISAEMAEIMGIDYVKLNAFEMDEVVLDQVQLDIIELDIMHLDRLGFYWIKRGVIGINKIGYLTELI